MSNPSPLRKLPHTVLHDTAKLHVINQSEIPSEIPSEVIQREAPSSDVQAFCALVARIMMRCLKERDERVMKVLSLSPSTEE